MRAAKILLDIIAARLAIWALRRVFGLCKPPHDPECMGCQAAALVAQMREMNR